MPRRFGARSGGRRRGFLSPKIDINGLSPGVYAALGAALWREGKRDDAVAAILRQIEAEPLEQAAHGTLAHFYYALGRYKEAIPEMDIFVSRNPNNTAVKADRGGAYLALGQTDKGVEILERLVQDSPTNLRVEHRRVPPGDESRAPDLAQQYAESAVTGAEARLPGSIGEPITVDTLRRMVFLANCWDTLGWVYFQQGKLDQADRFITAAWSLNADGAVGDHLGQLDERRGQKQEAMRAYSSALAARDPLPETRPRLEALRSDGKIEAQGEALSVAFPAGKLLADQAAADFYVAQNRATATVEPVFTRGDDRLRQIRKNCRGEIAGRRLPLMWAPAT